MSHLWIADRARAFDSSGIRKIFNLAANLRDPINLSIGQPDFDVPQPIRVSAIDAIESGKNAYALTQGITPLREKLQQCIDSQYSHADRKVFVSSGTSGALVLAMLALVNPGDEVIIFDPYFVMYPSLVEMVGGKSIHIDTYPDFQIDVGKVASAITSRTKLILLNSPNNPTGAVIDESTGKALANLAAQQNILLISDEIYRSYSYDTEFVSPAKFNDQTLVIDGFSKSHAMTGWRLGFAHGPADVIDTMIKLQQYTFVCAPHPFQWAALTALDVSIADHVQEYRQKRDMLVQGLAADYELTTPGGAFYLFAKAPWGTATEFVETAIRDHQLLIIPGNIFSRQDTHFRISYAASNETIARGIAALKKLTKHPPPQ